MNLNIISHCYISKKISEISTINSGTTTLYKEFYNKRFKKTLFCGVLYMAEDLFALSDGDAEIFLPEVMINNGKILQPRCPMEVQIDIEAVKEYRKKFDILLAYINTSSQIKTLCDGVYNGTEALSIFNKLPQLQNNNSIGLIGDKNVNWWLKQETKKMKFSSNIDLLTPNVFCPPHNKLTLKILNNFISEHCTNTEEYCLQFHSETNKDVLAFAMVQNSYIGGTTGIAINIKKNPKIKWIIPTIDNYIENVKVETNADVISPKMSCSSMDFVTLEKVIKAKKIIEENGHVAKLLIKEKAPFFDINIKLKQYVEYDNEKQIIPAVKLMLTDKATKNLKKKLLVIVKDLVS